MSRVIRIGTRDSELAVWQAMRVKTLLEAAGQESELVFVKSEGDQNLSTPLYEIGITGIFTKALDNALFQEEIDLAVHSLKDVPTQPSQGIIQAAVLTRGPVTDTLVCRENTWFPEKKGYPAEVVTGSLRRKAQWLNRFPNHTIHPIRGNVRTRLKKLQESQWDGAIFATAGLERLGIHPEFTLSLDWMLPAPAQGAIVVMARESDQGCFELCRQFNDEQTTLCVKQERDFLKVLEGGCSAPIGAYAWMENGLLHFKGNLLSPDGREKLEVTHTAKMGEAFDLGTVAAAELLVQGAAQILTPLRNGAK